MRTLYQEEEEDNKIFLEETKGVQKCRMCYIEQIQMTHDEKNAIKKEIKSSPETGDDIFKIWHSLTVITEYKL